MAKQSLKEFTGVVLVQFISPTYFRKDSYKILVQQELSLSRFYISLYVQLQNVYLANRKVQLQKVNGNLVFSIKMLIK